MRRGPNPLVWMALVGMSWFGAGCGTSEPDNPSQAVVAETAAAPPETSSDGGVVGQQQPGRNLHPRIVVSTTLGDFTVKLDAEQAPLTVDNFLSYVDEGFYDETVFHQVVDGYIVLGGGYTADLQPKTSQLPIRNEAHNGLSNRRGTIAMARPADAIDSATSQFFINLSDNATLDHQGRTTDGYGYCVFGQIVKGLDIVDQIGQVRVEDNDDFELKPVEQVVIRSIRRLR